MISALAPVAALLISVSILLAGQGLQIVLLPVRATLESFSTVSIGVIGAVYFLGFTLGCLKGGELVKRVGHVRVFLAMTALASASPLVHGLIVDEWTWAGLRLLSGFCFAVLYVVIESWLNECSTSANRGAVFGAYAMITLTLMAAGQMMVLLYEPGQLHLFALASVLVSVAAVPIALSTSPTPELPEVANPDLAKLIRTSPAGAAGCLATGLANGSFWALGPVFVTGVTGDVSLAAVFMTATVIGGSLGQWPLGRLSDVVGRRGVLIATAAIGAIAGVAIVYLGETVSPIVILLLGGLWGGVSFPMYSVAVAHTNDYAEPTEFVVISSSLLLVYGMGAISGPFVASAVMERFGAGSLFLFTAVVHVLFVLFAALRSVQREQAPQEDHISFNDALRAATTASRIYEDEVEQQAEIDESAAVLQRDA